ncbi:hypothetical protein PSEUBRA_006259 [Kalmanozyma brasiliensis GHG001]|uniref:uncharacterized protein n=1 Tax=Kalmanozyma brasiliensis (strain GHG001) TaxID=1365824 RepID=UPI002867CE26|nr:uncharacterized protein PSEUBRA_006259 [Kalmanozyma brasiliensis GHG001]KAF6767652.1 hypothetical protein PSEUBRA_006259 [Kalmanozyma brasiliensis GHG001]
MDVLTNTEKAALARAIDNGDVTALNLLVSLPHRAEAVRSLQRVLTGRQDLRLRHCGAPAAALQPVSVYHQPRLTHPRRSALTSTGALGWAPPTSTASTSSRRLVSGFICAQRSAMHVNLVVRILRNNAARGNPFPSYRIVHVDTGDGKETPLRVVQDSDLFWDGGPRGRFRPGHLVILRNVAAVPIHTRAGLLYERESSAERFEQDEPSWDQLLQWHRWIDAHAERQTP